MVLTVQLLMRTCDSEIVRSMLTASFSTWYSLTSDISRSCNPLMSKRECVRSLGTVAPTISILCKPWAPMKARSPKSISPIFLRLSLVRLWKTPESNWTFPTFSRYKFSSSLKSLNAFILKVTSPSQSDT